MKVIVDGIATEYRDEGYGPILLMLHGWGDSLHSFDALVERLEGNNRIVRLDLPGFGETEIPKETWDVGKYSRFVQDFCEKLKIAPELLVGHSLGGRILVKGLSNATLSGAKLVLIASAGVADRPTFRNNAFMVIAKVGKILLKPLPKSWYLRLRKELYRVTGGDYISTGALKDTFLNVLNEDLSADATRVAVPTLLVWGEDDIVTPTSEGKKLNHLIKGSELKIFVSAGHFVHQQKPNDVAALIQEFIS